MAERLLTMRASRVPHHGPVTADCLVECLLTVLSRNSFNPVARAYDAPFAEPRTVGDVLTLRARGQLREIHGLGPRRVSEIEAALVLAGLNLAARPATPGGPVPARTAAVTGPPRTRPGRARVPALAPRAYLDLGVVLTAPGCARAWTREILWEWGAAGLAEAAELVASELVTNAVSACAGLDRAVIRLILTLHGGELAVLVRDDHPGVPLAVEPGADDESGRGLLIVEHLSDRCGWYPLRDPEPAKVTWAVISGAGQAAGGPSAGPLSGAGAGARARAGPALPARRRQPHSPATAVRAPRPVDREILARVRSALQRV